MIFCVVGRPRPEPPGLVEKNASNICDAVRSSMPQPVSIRCIATRVALRRGAHDQLPAVGHRLLGVEDQVQQRLPKRLAVEHHARQLGIEIAHDLDARLLGLGREELEHVVDLVVQVRRLQMQPPHLGEVEKIVEQRLQPLALAADDLDLASAPAARPASAARRNPRPTAPC